MNETAEDITWLEFTETIKMYYDYQAKWVTQESFTSLMVAYSILIIFGCLGNFLVLITIMRAPDMRSARNVFIGNLALSDLCLCVVTMPLTLAIFVIISSLSISAIAIDRVIVICFLDINNWSTRTCLLVSCLIWISGMVVTTPLGVYKKLLSTAESLTLTGFPFSTMVTMYSQSASSNTSATALMNRISHIVVWSNDTNLYSLVSDNDKISNIAVTGHQLVVSQVDFLISEMKVAPGTLVSWAECTEEFPSPVLEKVYTTMTMMIQYLFPLVTVAVANRLIFSKLKDRLRQYNNMEMNDKRQADIQRMKRTCWLLISMVTIFLVCWLPLTLFNLFIDEIRTFLTSEDSSSQFFSIFALCHLFGMLSACTNPILYGFLNENFKKEFNAMFIKVRSLCRRREGEPVAREETITTNNGNVVL